MRHGVVQLTNGGWDFSEEKSVNPFFDPGADFAIAYVVDPPLGYRVQGLDGARLVMVPDSTFEELTEAPEDPSLYGWDLPGLMGVTYVIRTIEGHYAKFRILSLLGHWIEYAYQSDGSRMLAYPTPVERTTWGRIKALFE
jgi:hypothetical protein